jgi:hypothetical protein
MCREESGSRSAGKGPLVSSRRGVSKDNLCPKAGIIFLPKYHKKCIISPQNNMILYTFAQFWHSGYRAYRFAQVSFAISMAINLLIWLLLYFKLKDFSFLSDSGTIPLHFNTYFGIDYVAAWYMAFAMPTLGLMVIVLNNILAYVFFAKEHLLTQVLLSVEILTQFILLAAAIFTILLNV